MAAGCGSDSSSYNAGVKSAVWVCLPAVVNWFVLYLSEAVFVFFLETDPMGRGKETMTT